MGYIGNCAQRYFKSLAIHIILLRLLVYLLLIIYQFVRFFNICYRSLWHLSFVKTATDTKWRLSMRCLLLGFS